MWFKLFCLLQAVLLASCISRYAHPAVLENDANEALLPDYLRNPYYRTPRVANALARFSWFGPGEELVRERHAEKISRADIYTVLTHAGFVPRRFHGFHR
ncbi:uncharacterized protein LOC129733328 isoform X2 [Wyeomyia smithii]|uniref:uncharacterized protein LOC129733328 isoform X2 n=1 Tax=Wyeomyia smithii TaxID=174621 RepID=UPI002468145A|nr:uncharacterized protein LOC129733328 isoform X2 [Wyeomyia smithii]